MQFSVHNSYLFHCKICDILLLIGFALDWMYITDWRLDAIIRLHKLTGEMEKILVRESQNNRLYGVKVYAQGEQAVDPTHPCAINNGGCQKLCFAVPSPTKTGTGSTLKV